jgi:small subunit ribosomal protein S17
MSETPSDAQVHLRKTRVGVVISNKMDKTLVVEHVARVPHPKFNKIVKRLQEILRARREQPGPDR